MKNNYQICKKCIMDTSDKTIQFDEAGVCNYCKAAEQAIQQEGYRGKISDEHLQQMIHKIKDSQKGQEYDCVIGVSGGVDSAYLLYMAHNWGLRVLAVHVDAGWNSNTAVSNIHKLCEKLNIDLKTVVVDWNIMKEVQRAYMFSGLPNLDVPQDHVFFAALYDYANKYKIKYVLTGGNVATESILPAYLVYSALDYKCLKDVYKKNGRGKKLKNYPHLPYLKMRRYLRKLEILRPLDDLDYSKTKAMEVLEKDFGWEYYGGKHWESRFTKFLQGVYLPQKFGFNKSRAHLSNLVVNGEITREEALQQLEMEKELYPLEEQQRDTDYILKKLEISAEEWRRIMDAPIKTEDDYKNDKKRAALFQKIKKCFLRR